MITTLLTEFGVESYINAEQAVVVIVAVACALSIFTLIVSQKRSRALQTKIDRLQHDLRVANSGAIGMGQQLIAVEKQLNAHHSVSTTIESHKHTLQAQSAALQSQYSQTAQSMPAQDQDDEAIYQTARQLLAQGIDLDTIAKQSGLSHAEVSLINTLNQQGVNSSQAVNPISNKPTTNIHPLSTPS